MFTAPLVPVTLASRYTPPNPPTVVLDTPLMLTLSVAVMAAFTDTPFVIVVGPVAAPEVMAPLVGYMAVAPVLSKLMFLPPSTALTVMLPSLELARALANRFRLPPLTSMPAAILMERAALKVKLLLLPALAVMAALTVMSPLPRPVEPV